MRITKSNLFSMLLLILITPMCLIGAFQSVAWRENLTEVRQENESTLDDVDEEIIAEKAEKAVRCQFYENIGQVGNPDVKFYGNIPGGMIGFAESRIFLWMDGAESVITLSFEGAQDVVPMGIGEAGHQTSYFLGDRGTYTNIPSFLGVVYENLWSGIDLVYQATADGAKYEYRVAPGADPVDIRVCCEESDLLEIGKNSVRIEKGDWSLVDDNLRVYQEATNVEGEFDSLSEGVFGFKIGDYDSSKLLVIDPLLYSTYVGGSSDDRCYGITIDSSGNAYVTGRTESTDFPTVNAYNATGGGSAYNDVFVFKLSSDGGSLIYSTYVGGSNSDFGYGISIDSSGNAYVTGYTYSTNFPTVNAYNATGDGTSNLDVFVFKLSSDGSSLLYSTYVGGSEYDLGNGIAIDNSGNAYVTGETRSTDFPTVNAYNATGDGSTIYEDVFVFKLSADGSTLFYSTYVSGSNRDYGEGIAVDDFGNAYVTGQTGSSDFPIINAYDALMNSSDVYVFKLNSTGNGLNYSTYVGGSNGEYGYGIAIDSSGNAYVTGETLSADFPTVNAYDSTWNEKSDCFVFKLSSDGGNLIYSTYFGGSNHDYGEGIAVDSSGNAYVTGYNLFGDEPFIFSDVFVFKLSRDGSSLLYSTYVSGSYSERGEEIAVDNSGNAYVVGYTNSIDFPAVNAYNATNNGGNDVFVFKLSTIIRSRNYSTYVSGTDDENSYEIAVDSLGNVYVTGYTKSTDFPTVNAYNGTGDGTGYSDVFVFKLSADGSSLLYSTYVGGSNSDYGTDIAIDSSGNAYVTGYTSSTDFPTENAYDETGDTSHRDVFVFKLSANGSSLLYSTYVGGSNTDEGRGIAIDSFGNAYVTGYTYSTDFPTVSAYNATGDGDTSFSDVFVFKLTSTGNDLLYSTYVTGSNSDSGYGITIDSSGNAYVTGYTESTDFPTVNAYNETGDGNTDYTDVFVFKLSADGSSLLYSTYISGSNWDHGTDIAVDTSGNAYVTGETFSTDFPTVYAYDNTHGGDGDIWDGWDCFVFKLSSDGSSLLYSTYVGGSSYDGGSSVAVDDLGNAYVTGRTKSIDFPTINAYSDTYSGGVDIWGGDCFLFKLSSDGGGLLISSYVGGSHDDYGSGIVIDHFGFLYVTGVTKSTDFPTMNAYDTTGDGSTSYNDVFVFKMGEPTSPELDSPTDFSYEQGTTGYQITWNAGDKNPYQYQVEGNGSTVDWTAWSNGSIIVNVDGFPLGTYNYTIIIVDLWGNEAKDTVFVVVEDTTSPDLDSPTNFSYEQGTLGNQITWNTGDLNPSQYQVVGNGSTVDWTAWSNGTINIDVDDLTPGIYNYTIVVIDTSGNQVVDTVFVTVVDTTSPDLDSPSDFSYEQGTSGNEIIWVVGDLNPGQYRIDGNGTNIGWTNWSNETIHVNVDGHILGVYNYTITLIDDYGNKATDCVFVAVVDLTGPEISNIQQSPIDPDNDDEVLITVNVTDAISDVVSVRLYYRTKPEDGIWSSYTYISMGLQSGDTYGGLIPEQVYATQVGYYVWAEDNWSNTADTSSSERSYIVISVDTEGPFIGLSRNPTAPTELDDVIITATVTDDSSIFLVVLQYTIDDWITWTNITMTLSGGQWTAPIPKQEIGVEVKYRVHARDSIGNWATSTPGSYVVVNSVDYLAIAITAGELIGAIVVVIGGLAKLRNWRANKLVKATSE